MRQNGIGLICQSENKWHKLFSSAFTEKYGTHVTFSLEIHSYPTRTLEQIYERDDSLM